MITAMTGPNFSREIILITIFFCSCHLENIKGESERLQDLFDFSVIANANCMLSKLLTDFREVLKDADGKENKKDCKADDESYKNFR